MSRVHLSPDPITHTALCRLVRVGATPVMAISVTYPVLSPDAASHAPEGEDSLFASRIARFNDAYRAMAEAFADWAAGAPAAAASEAFVSAGPGAAYTFDRRLLTCRMEATLDGEGRLTVRRTVRTGSRRGTVPAETFTTVDRWRTEDLSLLRPIRELANTAVEVQA